MNPSQTTPLRVLAVDDEPTVLDVYRHILSPAREGSAENFLSAHLTSPEFEIVCCTQGDEAIGVVRASIEDDKPFAVVFLDLNMPPGPDGEWTAEQIQKIDPHSNIILVTGYMSTNTGDISRRSSLPHRVLYLQKPFHRREILQFASALSTKWRAERELRALHAKMESLVEKRTAALVKANRQLKIEIESRRKAQKALRMSEINFRNMINNNADGILILDEGGVVRFMNPAAAAMFGTRAGSLIGKTFNRPVSREKSIELDIPRREGTSIVAEMRVMETEWEGRRTLLASLRDITERQRMQRELQQSLENLKEVMHGTIKAMALTVETRDPYTSGHQQRVADLVRAIAREIGLPAERIEGAYMGAGIHDIGKISLPAEILSKPGQLSEIEVRLIQEHPKVGYEILRGIDFPWPIAEIVLQHHERLDGSGYPRNLAGNDILLEARIVGVADVVETMSSHRPYRPSIGLDKAIEEITTQRGRLYDPDVVDACLKVVNEKEFEFLKLQRDQ
jgi:putative nucleotidyltransferase with HDIG domain